MRSPCAAGVHVWIHGHSHPFETCCIHLMRGHSRVSCCEPYSGTCRRRGRGAILPCGGAAHGRLHCRSAATEGTALSPLVAPDAGGQALTKEAAEFSAVELSKVLFWLMAVGYTLKTIEVGDQPRPGGPSHPISLASWDASSLLCRASRLGC
jgi:hypothetical protein